MRATSIETFHDDVMEAHSPVLVVFYSEYDERSRQQWRSYKYSLEEFEQVISRKVTVVTVDIDQELELADVCEVFSLPSTLLFADGLEVDRMIGVQTTIALCRMVTSVMGKTGLALAVKGILRTLRG